MTTKMTETFWGGTAHQIFRFPAKEKLTENSINKGPRAVAFILAFIAIPKAWRPKIEKVRPLSLLKLKKFLL